MNIYSTLVQYANEKQVTILTAKNKFKSGRIIKLMLEGKKVGYIDTLEWLNIINSHLQNA